MRRVLCLMLAMTMLLALAACGDNTKTTDEETTPQKTEAVSKTEEPTELSAAGKHEIISLDFIRTFDKKPSMDEQVIYDKGDITVTATGIRYDTVSGPQVLLSVKNGAENDVLIQNGRTAVNGFMIEPEINITVPAGKTIEAPMSLPYLALALADIHSIYELEFWLQILDSLSYALIDSTDVVKPVLTDTAKEKHTYQESGKVAYDDKGVRIVMEGVKQDTLFDNRFVIPVYMVNDSDKTVSILNIKLVVNGYEITHAMHTVVLPGKKAVDVIELFDNELDENCIAVIDSVEAAFNINDYEEWTLIAETPLVSLDLETPITADAIAEEAEEES